MYKNILKYSVAVVLAATIGCAPSSPDMKRVVIEVDENPVHGQVQEVWEEPMYDQVVVPGKLDPTGTYYRPAHRTVVEIRPGRYQEVQYPKSNDRD